MKNWQKVARQTAEKGLYTPQDEHDNCGIGFIANISGEPRQSIVRSALCSVEELVHRGACDADAKTGDGAGILTQLPHDFFRHALAGSDVKLPIEDTFGVGQIFLPRNDENAQEILKTIVEGALSTYDLPLLGWRRVPVDVTVLGEKGLDSRPDFRQVFIAKPDDVPGDKFERLLYLARKHAERQVEARGNLDGFYVASMSSRTIIYKGLFVAPQLGRFFPDLTKPQFKSAVAVFHQRYSTNTFPTWSLAQPFRMLGHNGEINTLQGNLNWMRARERELASDLWGDEVRRLEPIIQAGASDSANLDNILEMLVLSGRDPLHALLMLAPQAWENDPLVPDDLRAFFKYHATLTEPWDGPAAIVFTDGKVVGATLDRNGLRPARYKITEDGRLIVGSEVGTLGIEDDIVIEKGRLGPGNMIAVDLEKGELLRNDDIKKRAASQQPYGDWLENNLIKIQPLESRLAKRLDGTIPEPDELNPTLRAFGYGQEDVKTILLPMFESGKEPTGSMGDDTPLACLSEKPRMIYDYFKQRFAQVTNPPIDPIRERKVTSMHVYLGASESILEETPEHCRRVLLRSPILDEAQMEWLESIDKPGIRTTRLSLLFPATGGQEALRERLRALRAEAEAAVDAGATILILSDQGVDQEAASVPAMLATAAVHHGLIRAGKRMRASLITETGEARTTHHLACLIGYGASAVYPYLIFEQIARHCNADTFKKNPIECEDAANNTVKALQDGLLKIMSKMGISTVSSYTGAQIFEALGFSEGFLSEYFTGTRCALKGLGLETVAADQLRFHAEAFGPPAAEEGTADSNGSTADDVPAGPMEKLVNDGYYRTARNGEYHHNSPDIVRFLHGVSGIKPVPPKVFEKADAELSEIEKELEVEKQSHVLTAPRRSKDDDADEENLAADQGERIDRIRRLHALPEGERGKREYEIFSSLVNRREPTTPRDLLDIRTDRKNSIPLDQVEPASEIMKRFTTAAMSLGALSPESHEALAVAMNRIGGKSNSGEGGEDPRRFRRDENGDLASSMIKQIASARFGVTPEYLVNAKQLEIKMAQGSKPGEGGQLPGHKVSIEIARLRHSTPGVTLISPPPHHDIYSIEDLAQLIYDLKIVNPRAKVCVKLVSEVGIGTVAAGVAKASADVIHISGHDGGTGASPLSSIKSAGSAWELGLAEAQQVLIANGLRGHVSLRVDGGLKNGRDCIIAALMGAEEYGFGTAVLIATGCVMARQCHLNTCPVGIATQRKDLRQKFKGTADQVVEYLTFVAEEIREHLAVLGYRTMDEIIGRVHLLERRETSHPKHEAINVAPLLYNPDPDFSQAHRRRRERNDRLVTPLDDTILLDAQDAITGRRSQKLHYYVRNVHRAVGARIAGTIAFHNGNAGLTNTELKLRLTGSAGQSLGAFCINGMNIFLEGEANDYVGKCMNGGQIIIRPREEAQFDPSENVIIGNTVLYGATGGQLFVRGRAGERFAVRNSGAEAVVEGVGDHGCEYMTGGTVVVLGPVGDNFAAGMTGGVAYVYDPDDLLSKHLNKEHVQRERVERMEDSDVLLELLDQHSKLTGSQGSGDILNHWDREKAHFWKVSPRSAEEIEKQSDQPVKDGRALAARA